MGIGFGTEGLNIHLSFNVETTLHTLKREMDTFSHGQCITDMQAIYVKMNKKNVKHSMLLYKT